MNIMNNTQETLANSSYEDMMKAGMHFGRRKSIFHPNMKPFVFTTKENIYIIDLLKTVEGIKTTIEFVKKVIADNKIIVFVALTKQSAAPIKSIAKALNMPYVDNRWLGGTLTNFKTILGRVKYLEELEKQQQEGGFAKYTKKEVVLKEREIAKLKKKFDGLRGLTRVPDVLFLSSLKEGQLPLHEAKITNVKVISLVNTDSDPTQVDYAIPANDNSKKSIELILDLLQKGIADASVLPA